MIKNVLKKSIFRFSILCGLIISLTSITTEPVVALHFEDALCKLETSTVRCNDVQNGTDVNYVILKITNKTDQKVIFSFQKQISFSNKPNASVDGGNTIIVELAPNEVLEGSCEKNSNGKLRIFSHMESLKDVATLTSYSFSDFKTKYN